MYPFVFEVCWQGFYFRKQASSTSSSFPRATRVSANNKGFLCIYMVRRGRMNLRLGEQARPKDGQSLPLLEQARPKEFASSSSCGTIFSR
ncbi:hypothetical protein KFK09_007844 [Dendrobium nobile]|uniref:Uncharacterized protein n=1 Tax=Dendrobium nobile TaxID=94219 RepID=A0A8T3BSW1_DENNO|nr:hypothetical protein KFK09_007844 [Dendrobium nobile]